MMLGADREAATVIGKEPLLGVLRKIELIGFKDVEMTEKHKFLNYLTSKPSVRERIENLTLSSSISNPKR